jgi:hypothetical protein
MKGHSVFNLGAQQSFYDNRIAVVFAPASQLGNSLW